MNVSIRNALNSAGAGDLSRLLHFTLARTMNTRFLFCAALALVAIGCTGPRKAASPESTAYLAEAMRQPLTFTLPMDQTNAAWARAQTWISQHARPKIKTVTEFVIQTEDPPEMIVEYGYSVTKQPLDYGATFTVSAKPGNSLRAKQADQNAHLLAYHMASGKPTPADLVE